MSLSLRVAFSGFLFALGLGISGMADGNKVVNFLDVSGNWDPSLAFVMVGAIAVYAPLHYRIFQRSAPTKSPIFHLPIQTEVDNRLVGGAFLFGTGWGLTGICPGPALVAVMSLGVAPLIFIVGMVIGMFAYQKFDSIEPDAVIQGRVMPRSQ